MRVRAAPWRHRMAPAGALAAAAALALVVGESTGWPFLRAPLQSALERAVGLPVRLGGDFHLRLGGGPTLRVAQLQVGAAAGVSAPYLLRGEDVEVEARWRDLWRWRFDDGALRLHRLEADRLDAHLVRHADGRASGPFGPADAAPGATTKRTLPHVGTLVVRRGRIDVDDAVRDLRLQVRIDDRSAGPGDARVYTVSATGLHGAEPLQFLLRAGAVLPLRDEAERDTRTLVPVLVEAEAGGSRLQFDGRMAALFGGWRIDGGLRLRGPSLDRVGAPLGLTLPSTTPFELSGWLSHGLGVWHLRAERLSVGRSRLSGDFRFDTRSRPWRLGGRLSGPVLALADLGPALGTTAATAATAGADEGARVLPRRPFDLPAWRRMDARVQVAIEEVDLGGGAWVPLRNVQGELLLTDGVLRLQDLKGGLAGGRLSGSSALDGRGDAALWSARLQLRGVEATEAARDGVGPQGELAADLRLGGRGASTAQILGSLQGSLDLRMRDGLLAHPGSERLGQRLANALGVETRDAPLRCARVDLALQQGRVVPRTAVLGYGGNRVRVEGYVDLRDESVALRLSVQGGPAQALQVPLSVDGTLSQPLVAGVAALVTPGPPSAVTDPVAGAEPCAAPPPRRY